MNRFPLSQSQARTVALTMLQLDMLQKSSTPASPPDITGRESECIQARLGMPTVVIDDALQGYLDAYAEYLAWSPDSPVGISAHKLLGSGWLITARECAAALAALQRSSLRARQAAVQSHAQTAEDAEAWEDWLKILQASAESGFPVRLGDPTEEGDFAEVELALDSDYLTR